MGNSDDSEYQGVNEQDIKMTLSYLSYKDKRCFNACDLVEN